MSSLRQRGIVALALIVLLALGSVVRSTAQGFIVPDERFPITVERGNPFAVRNVKVTATITDNVADTTVEQTFLNTSSIPAEGTYLFPLPDGATVTSMTLKSGEQVLEGRVLTKEEARQVYESIVRRRRDPALLEYVGRGLFRASVFPIPPHGESVITLKYAQVLRSSGGLKNYSYPLSTDRFSSRPVLSSSVSVKLRTGDPLKTVYSPSHNVSVKRVDENNATASWEGQAGYSERDFTLLFDTNRDDVGLSLLTYKTGEKDGYFLLVASPRVTVPQARILPKQIVFVLDRTGSMQANNKMVQAKAALKHCLSGLNAQDRFGLLTFNESADLFQNSLLPATPENLAKAQKFVEETEASGGTNIDEALKAGLALLKKETGTQKMLVFLTDGLPTVGETSTETILAHVRGINRGRQLANVGEGGQADNEAKGIGARIFCFGVGYDVNVPFLDRLATENRADADFVKPTENIETTVSNFFAKVNYPILSNLKLAFDDAQVYDVFPKELPDLFKGSQVVISGRFRGEPKGGIRLAGFAQGQERGFSLAGAFDGKAIRSELIPRIWAARKIGYLTDAVRLNRNQEVIDEIVRLSREYGIVTEYTSYLADERQMTQLSSAGGAGGRFGLEREEVLRRAKQKADKDGISGESATDASRDAKSLKEAPAAPGLFYGRRSDRANSNYTEKKSAAKGGLIDAEDRAKLSVRVAGDRAFYRQANGEWQDALFEKQSVTEIKAYSDAHFALLKALPMLTRYSGVGEEVTVVIGKRAVHIGKTGKTSLTDAELREITEKP